MNYQVEFIVCFNDGTWIQQQMPVPEDIVCLGTDEMVVYALEHDLSSWENVCHIGVMNFYTEEDENDTSTLTYHNQYNRG